MTRPEPLVVKHQTLIADEDLLRRASELEEERNFLLSRLTGGRFGMGWGGISSNEMLRVAISGDRINGFNVPYDEGDLAGCVGTHNCAPEHLKPRMLPILEGFRLLLSERRAHKTGSYTLEQATEWAEDAIRHANKAERSGAPKHE